MPCETSCRASSRVYVEGPISLGLVSTVSSLLSPLLSSLSSLPCQSHAKGDTMGTVESDSQPDKLHERIPLNLSD